jgi:hypothetical protein
MKIGSTMRFMSVVLNVLAEVFGAAMNASSGKLYINTALVQKWLAKSY